MRSTATGLAHRAGRLGRDLRCVILVAFASNKRVQLFTTNTRRNTTVALYSSAQPYRAVAEHSGSGGQTLPPDAHIGGFPVAETEAQANAVDAALTKKG